MTKKRNTKAVRPDATASLLAPGKEQKDTIPPPPALMAPAEAPTGERSETGGAGAGAIRAAPPPPDPEVAAKPTRRTFSADYKLRILEEVEQAGPGGAGEILRREGLYSSHLTVWRRARRRGALQRLGRKRGRKPRQVDQMVKKIEQLERALSRTREQLRKAEVIIEVQGKVAGLLGFSLEDERNS